MSDSRFILEQRIMDCWGVCEDLMLVFEETLDSPQPMSDDELANILLGMEQLYQRKFSRLFQTFEVLVGEISRNNANTNINETTFDGLTRDNT